VTDQLDKLRQIQCFLMDMDGTIYLGNQLLPGAQDWLDLLEEHSLDYYFLTNNSSRSRVEYAQKFVPTGPGCPRGEDLHLR
jgi:4-nitrophenyl phosphatase